MRNVQGGAGADHGEHVGVVIAVGRQDRTDDLDFVDVPGWEQRSDRSVDQPRGQGVLHGRTPFPLDETAGKLAGGGGPFPVVNDQGEEPFVGIGLPFDGGRERHGVAEANHDGAVRLSGDFSGFEAEGELADLRFDLARLH